MVEPDERVDTVVVGAGQAGLATAYHLQRRDRACVVLEADARVGDVWRRRFDSLRLYSPARYDGLPGLAFPGDPWSFPTKDEMADYLEAYAAHFALPVRTGVRTERLRDGGSDGGGTSGFTLETSDGPVQARTVVVATGGWASPVVPPLAAKLDPGIVQLHSSAYSRPEQLPDGPVLVVGASHSGADIAHEVAATHRTILAGHVHGELPVALDSRAAHAVLPVLWFVANHVLTERTPVGRRVRPHIRQGGGPLLRVKRAHLAAAGVEHHEQRVAGVRGGQPVLDDGTVLDVATVVWCTGFRSGASWLDLPVDGADGWPEQRGGASPAADGLYFVGVPFQSRFASMLVGGVQRDAAAVARQIAARS